MSDTAAIPASLLNATIDHLARFAPFSEMRRADLEWMVERLSLAYTPKGGIVLDPAQGPVRQFQVIKQGSVVSERLGAGAEVSAEQRSRAESILRAVGAVVWVNDESELDWVTALSGSGPAYVFYFIEALQNSGTALGLPPATARRLAVETFLGAARLAAASDEPVDDLRMRVTSKGGTTAAAIEVFNTEAVDAAIAQGVAAAAARGRELCDILGAD